MKEKMNCNVIRDLIPLCAEGLCSEESKALIEAHVETCADCKKLYEKLPAEPEQEIPVPAEGRAFQKVNRRLRWSGFTKVMAVIFCVLLVMFAACNAVWYVRIYRPYRALCENWQSSDRGKGTQYTRQDADFSYTVKMPGYLSFEGGFIAVQTNESHPVYDDENGHPAVEIGEYVSAMFIWLDQKGTQYGVDIQRGSVGYQMYIDRELNLVPFEDQTSADTVDYRSMIEEHRDEIEALMNAAQNMWGDKL